MSRGVRFQAEPIKWLGGAAINGTFQPLADESGNTLIKHVIRQFYIDNDTDGYVMVSFDGLSQHIRLAPGVKWMDDVATNRLGEPNEFALPINYSVYVAQTGANFPGDTNPTTGFVTLSCFYAYGDGEI